MRLYLVTSTNSDLVFYWAETMDEAKEMFVKDTSEAGAILAEQVWANNADSRYRGYVVKE